MSFQDFTSITLDSTISSSLLKEKLSVLNTFRISSLSLREWNDKNNISLMLFYSQSGENFVLVEENLGYGMNGINVYVNNGKFDTLVTKLVYDCFKTVRCMCLERVDQHVDFLVFVGDDQRLFKYNLKEWIENSKLGMDFECVWKSGLKYNPHYTDDAFCYPRSVVVVEANGKFGVNGNLIVVLDTDNSRIKIMDSKDGVLLKIISHIEHVKIYKPYDLIYSKELDVFLMANNRGNELIKFRLRSDNCEIISEMKSQSTIWGMHYEPRSRIVFLPQIYLQGISILNLETMVIDYVYHTKSGMGGSMFFDPKYQRLYNIENNRIVFFME